jgi:hypothetical protein
MNGTEPVAIHYEYTFDADGKVSGLQRVMVTTSAGTPIVLEQTDVVYPGCCQPAAPVLPSSDFELVAYDDSAAFPGNKCRKIILIATDDIPPVFSGFEMDTSPIAGFDPNYIREKCPCLGNVPTIAW